MSAKLATARPSRKLTLPYRYTPRGYQRPFWDAMRAGAKRAALVWHRRAGKDKTAWNWTILAAAALRPGIYYYFLPTYSQGKKVIWDGMDREGMRFLDHVPPELVINRNETEMKLWLRHASGGESIVQIVGTDNWNSIMGTNPVGVVFSEYAIQDPRVWEYVQPILLENDGWAVFASTPRGKNHWHRLWERVRGREEWFTQLLTVRDTKREDGSPVISELNLDAIRAEGADEEVLAQEYYCSFSGSLQGSYYGRLMDLLEREGHLTRVPWEPTIETYTWWDLGVEDTTAIWFVQPFNQEVRVIDFFEGQGEGLSYYARELRSRPYVYGEHLMPHDIRVRELGSGVSREETAMKLGIRPIRVAPKLDLMDGIEASRLLLPKCYFDAEKCAKGLDALRTYHKEFDEDRRTFKMKPVHDWSSNAADAFRTGAVSFRGRRPEEPRYTRAETDFDPFRY